LRLNRFIDGPATFFITKTLHPKKAILNEAAMEVIVSALSFAEQNKRIYLRAFVVMPDHWHALFAVTRDWPLPRTMHAMMSFIGGKTHQLLQSRATEWQETYYDTRIQTARQFEYVAHYIENNPVKKGLVEKADHWRFSSAATPHLTTDPWPWPFDK
jgi:putative transposase